MVTDDRAPAHLQIDPLELVVELPFTGKEAGMCRPRGDKTPCAVTGRTGPAGSLASGGHTSADEGRVDSRPVPDRSSGLGLSGDAAGDHARGNQERVGTTARSVRRVCVLPGALSSVRADQYAGPQPGVSGEVAQPVGQVRAQEQVGSLHRRRQRMVVAVVHEVAPPE